MLFRSHGTRVPPLCFKVAPFLPLPLPYLHYAMSEVIVIDAEQKAAAIAKAGADLTFLLDRKQVGIDFQAKLFHIGVTSVELFSVFAKNQEELEGLPKEHFGLDPKKIEHRIAAGRVIVAWMAANIRTTTRPSWMASARPGKSHKTLGLPTCRP